jgi:hypothetical protein
VRRERQSKRRRRLTQAELRAIGTVPGLLVTRYDATGERATVHQLSPEGSERRRDFARRLTDDSQAGEGEASDRDT